MYNLLKGKRGIIFGALDENSIAWKVAEKAKEEGATFVLTNTRMAIRMGNIKALAKKCKCKVIASDATDVEDLEKLYKESIEILGGKFDFVLHSIGMSPNVRKQIPYDDINYSFYEKTLDISALSFHKVLQTAKKLDAINEWGSVIALSHIAAQRPFPEYGDMAEAKSCLESIARNFGMIYGREKKVRVNTISQSPTKTTAGNGIKGFGDLYDISQLLSPLGNATSEECADYCISLFSDLTRMVTMQNLYHDGGYSNTGFTIEGLELLRKGKEASEESQQ